ncbi:hypothetical protein JQU17_05415 [Ponticoccus sp. SC2-23]|uniref:tetratricopeptide repeat protein n=1 Tax=Alexandriicola marinus TaxID=2081710 RepID=UPI000FD75056|nr:hypothetical protein [Alexandriicola marinus]MBM1219628.1 hypothetical protein [Ponticoccus sp. SC6-9]MBM1223300.1 hypothetical protein [Ponticoccus sp. SC6-15]MBM1232266.1 hypothetical protein [Ponticoccus sp. SC6-45]MBM1237784.1 hypothetical protein [Ponticoccus sp. SC6-49]MBM1241277.1 hypothetical protein [Ponticoccus sp. SC2-64]MBM1245790.1 hypothetical protein [Ponticoccus sp. SC6-42]MBM1250268.1 hypothetical protein [Ponticoccus sp. SC6-33]MBM1255793.1 hypothetical protein [Pontico
MFPGGFAGRLALTLMLAAAPAAAQTIRTDAAGLRELAALSLADNNWAQARALSEALLERNSDDMAALSILSQAAFRMGDFATARTSAARVYRSDAPKSRRYQAARLAALAAVNEDRFTLAELWLRRALIVAPTPEDVAETTNDARQVRRANPWSTNVQLSFSPSTNINGGATSELNYIDGVPIVGVLSASAQALTGFVALADLRTTYRLNETSESRQTVSARVYARAPIPVGESLQAIEDEGVKIEEFSTARLEFSFAHDQVVEDGLFGINADIGGYWAGAEYDYSYLRLGLDRTFRLTPELSLTGSGYAEQRFAPDDFAREDVVLSLSGSVVSRMADGSQGSATLSWQGRDSDSVNNTYNSYTFQLGYTPAEQFGPVQLSGAVGVQYTDYPDYVVGFILVPDGREDTRLFGNVTALFPDYSFAGFSPLVRMNVGTTDSNISRFEVGEFGVELGLRSTF